LLISSVNKGLNFFIYEVRVMIVQFFSSEVLITEIMHESPMEKLLCPGSCLLRDLTPRSSAILPTPLSRDPVPPKYFPDDSYVTY
jgi:hypothetical protein